MSAPASPPPASQTAGSPTAGSPTASSPTASSPTAAGRPAAGQSLAAALDAAASTAAASITGYQLLGPKLSEPAAIAAARRDEQAQRDAADAALAQLASLGAPRQSADPAVALPPRVPDDLSARQLATQLEDAAAASWRAVLVATFTDASAGAAASAVRGVAMDQLSSAALRGYGWRATTAPNAPTVAFPGLAG